METSDSYIVVEQMIRRGEISAAELEPLLRALEGQEQITPEEHLALLMLSGTMKTDNASAS